MPEKDQKELSPKKVLWTLLAFIGALGLIFGLVGGFATGSVQKGFHGAGVVVTVLVGICFLSLLATAIHECAHLVVGWCTGHRLYLFRVSYFQFVKVGDRFRCQLEDAHFLSGECGMGLCATNRQFVRLYVFIIAAPLASIGYAYFVVHQLHFANDAGFLEFLRPISLFMTVPALYMAIAPALHSREGDLWMLEQLRRNPRSAPTHGAVSYLVWQDASRHRPRNYRAEYISVLNSVQPGDRFASAAGWYLWSHNHDAGNFEGMNRAIESLSRSASAMVVEGKCDEWSDYGDLVYAVAVIDALYDIRRTSHTEKAVLVLELLRDDESLRDRIKSWHDALELAVLGTKNDGRRYEAANRLYCDLCPSEFGQDQIEEYVREQIEIWVPDFDDSCGGKR